MEENNEIEPDFNLYPEDFNWKYDYKSLINELVIPFNFLLNLLQELKKNSEPIEFKTNL